MSGKRINDHSWWGGAAQKGEVFPKGAKTKMETSAGGEGELSEYWDTTEKLKQQQEMGQAKIRSHPMKQGYRY